MDGEAPASSKQILVVPDTNGLTSSNLLQSSVGSALADLLGRCNGCILLPEVIELELGHVLCRKLLGDGERARNQIAGLEAVVRKSIQSQLPSSAELESAIKERLTELQPLLRREPFTFEIARAALIRVIEKKPPSGSNNEQFRDCCIWEHCIRLGKHYDVHLVTTDSDFYENKKSEKGLAQQLTRELEKEGASVHVHLTLSKLIEHLSPSVPPHDADKLGRGIGQAARGMLEPRADTMGFLLGELTYSHVQVAPTKTPLHQLVTFDLTYSLIEKTENQGRPERLNPQLSASGNCTLTLPSGAINDVRMDNDKVHWTDLSGATVEHRQLYAYVGLYASTGLDSSSFLSATVGGPGSFC